VAEKAVVFKKYRISIEIKLDKKHISTVCFQS